MTQKQNKNSRPKFFESKRAIQIICVGVALVFWVLIKLSKPYRTTQEFNIVYNKPSGTTFTELPPQSLTATLNGQGWDLMSSYFQGKDRNLTISLDSNSLKQTLYSTQLVSRISQRSKDIVVSGVNIDMLTLNIESEITKKVPVILRSNLEFNNLYQLKEAVSISPDSIEIKGPASTLEQINQWETENWESKNISSNQEKMLNLLPPYNALIEIEPKQITAQLSVEQLTEKSIFVPITIKNAPDSLQIFPKNIKLSCIVGLSHYDSLSAKDFALEVDLKGIALNATNNTLPILLSQQPDYVKGVNLNHQSVEFFFVQSNPNSTLGNPSSQR